MEFKSLTCKCCGEPLKATFADLGVQPLCESYLSVDQLIKMEPTYLLHVYFCEKCLLVQLEESISPQEIYKTYAYFSSSSKGWLNHCESYSDMIIGKLGLTANNQVIEVGSNDGYLLQFFAKKNIPVLGIEPASNVAEGAIKKGIPTFIKFFDKESAIELANQNMQADLLIGNNIIAQVPDIHGFLDGLKILLKPSGIITLEFHYIRNMVEKSQFDTISHERFYYFSFFIVEKLLALHGLRVFNVEEIPTHGGSLRIYATHVENQQIPKTNFVDAIKDAEQASGLKNIETYLAFGEKVKETKRNLLAMLIEIKRHGKSVIGYGAHAEAHTLLNYCGIRTDFLDYLVDRNPQKQGKFQAGTRLPIFSSECIQKTKPDYVLVLPWSIKIEIMKQLVSIDGWSARFIVPIPKLEIYDAKGNDISNTILKEEVV